MQETLLDFISSEHHNELVSLTLLNDELRFFAELDKIYQSVIKIFSIDQDNELLLVCGVFFLQVHNELYVSFSQLLKSNRNKAFISLRIAIDASLNAYYLTINPENTKDFFTKESKLQKKIFCRMKGHIAKNTEKYPLAEPLIDIYGFASKFAHSSPESLMHKFKQFPEKNKLQLNYFEELNNDEVIFYYFHLLKGYYLVLRLFYDCCFKTIIKSKDFEIKLSRFVQLMNVKFHEIRRHKKS